jgi:hypothetical protein
VDDRKTFPCGREVCKPAVLAEMVRGAILRVRLFVRFRMTIFGSRWQRNGLCWVQLRRSFTSACSLLAFGILPWLWGSHDLRAQSPGDVVGQSSGSQQKAAGVQSDKPTPPAESDKESEKTKKEKKESRRSLVVAPLPLVSPAIGSGLIPVVGYIFPFSKSDQVSPPSTVGGAGLITNNGTSGFAVGGQLFMKEDTYEVTAGYGHGDLYYNLYGIGFLSGQRDLKLPLDQAGQVFFIEGLRRLVWKIFVGPRFSDGSSFITVRPNNGNIPPLPPDLGLHTELRALGFKILRDTRPNHFYPTAGMFIQFTGDFFSQTLGSKYSFQSYKFHFDKYTSLAKNQVLAYDLYVCNTGGSPPFYGNCIYGANNELRGYTAGRYLDRHMFATQVEYRLSLPKKIGLAGFAGFGEVFPGPTQILRSNRVLPDIGGGPRYELSSKYHVNLRADFARGRDSWTWSMGVGEAF